jgi:hypothetical protein
MFKTPERRGVALGLAASLAILVLTLICAKINSIPVASAFPGAQKVAIH